MSEQLQYDNEVGRVIDNILALTHDIEESALDDDADLIMDLPLDSLDRVELIMEIEKEFNIGINSEDSDEINTLGELKVLVTKLKTAQNAKEAIK